MYMSKTNESKVLKLINNIDDKKADKVFSGQDILDRLSDVYMGEYHLLNNNCEHFAKWARNDRKVSLQSLFAFYRLSFLMMVTFLIVMCIGAYVVWKDISLEERNDTKFCGCRSLLDEDKYENVPYSYGEIFIAKRIDGENNEFLHTLVQLLESKNFSSVINSKQILIKSKSLFFCEGGKVELRDGWIGPFLLLGENLTRCPSQEGILISNEVSVEVKENSKYQILTVKNIHVKKVPTDKFGNTML